MADFPVTAHLYADSTCEWYCDTPEMYPLTMAATSGLSVRVRNATPASPSDGRGRYRVEIMYPDPAQGANWVVRLGDLENARLGSIGTELNKIGEFTFSLPTNDPKAALIQAPDREVRVWRGGRLLWWGVVTRAVVDETDLKVSCKTLEWYFTKRVFGRAGRTNLLTNGSFESGRDAWTIGFWPGSALADRHGSFEISQENVIDGQRSLKLEQRASVTGVSPEGYAAGQGVRWTVDPATVADDAKGETWTAVVWMYVPRATWEGYSGPASGWGGMRVVRFSTTHFYELYEPDIGGNRWEPDPLGQNFVTFDGESFDKWIRLEAELDLPIKGGEPEDIIVFLEAMPGAVTFYDRATLTRDETSIWKGTDQVDIFAGIVNHAQDTSYGKSDLKIVPQTTPTGIKRTRIYKHEVHQQIGDALDEFPNLHQGFDWGITFSPTARYATTFYPRRGIRKPWALIETGRNLVSFTVAIDGERVANSVIVLGEGEGSDREEGGASDPGALSGGLVLEKVYHATPGSAVASLGEQATRGVNRFKQRVQIPEVTIHHEVEDLVGEIEVGDIVPVHIEYGWVSVEADYRVIGVKHDPAKEHTALTLNPVSDEVE